MIKYDISENFLTPDVCYPFNIFDVDDNRIQDFWEVIESTARFIANDKTNKVRFIWIEAEGYCQTEVFLKRILIKHSDVYPVLYLHWIDYVESCSKEDSNPLSTEIKKIVVNQQYFSDVSGTKICVIDHAEEITKLEHLTNLCETFKNSSFIFIFISKRGNENEIDYWNRILLCASNDNDDDKNTGIIRSKDNFFRVKRYSIDDCKQIIQNTHIFDEKKKKKCCSIVDELNVDLRRAYYFDLFLTYILKISKKSEDLVSLNHTALLESIYLSAIQGVVRHLRGHSTLEEYIRGYYASDFVKNNQLDFQRRVPIDSYAWAYGIVEYAPKRNIESYYREAITYLIDSCGKTIESFNQIFDIISHVVNFCKEKNSIKKNKYFSLTDCLIKFSNTSCQGALVVTTVLNRMLNKFDREALLNIFYSICEMYLRPLSDEEQIYLTVSLGYEIGKLIPHLPNEAIEKGLGCFFKTVKDDYVCPACNSNGISAVSVTNYEFAKFVMDGGYHKYYEKIANFSLKEVAAKYYQEIIDFIFSAMSGDNVSDSQSLMKLLKGYDWFQLRKLAILFSNRQVITADKIKALIQDNNYPHPLCYPAKWGDSSNSNPEKPFCNPLEPVVCVNYFEAIAYAQWLSDKIGKPVRLVKYDPDYISLIGSDKNPQQRSAFLNHVKQNQNYINTVENGKWCYGDDNIAVREPTPMSLANSYFGGIYDFLGNVFETQETMYQYNYDVKVSEETLNFFESKESCLIDYNCPCGGLQRTKANLPPVYMGQVPAFLRNQDIGFRIVIDGKDEIGDPYKKKRKEEMTYGESVKCLLSTTHKQNDFPNLLYGMSIIYNDEVNRTLYKAYDFYDETYRAALYSNDNSSDDTYEYIMLLQNNNDIFAYRLSRISRITENHNSKELFISMKYPIVSPDFIQRKRYSNKSLAGWIDFLQLYSEKSVETFLAYPLNISSSYFVIDKCMIRRNVIDGVEIEDVSSLVGSYKLSFNHYPQLSEVNHKLDFLL